MDLYSSGIRPLVDDYIESERQKLRDYGSYWSASSAGYCWRKTIFERLGVPPVSPDARKQRVFSAGDIFHQWIQKITKDSGLSIAQELELQDEELMIRGHIDDLVLVFSHLESDEKVHVGKYEPINRLILYDYKTAHSKWFEYAKTKPMSHYHRHQLGIYMYMLRRYFKTGPKIGFDVIGYDVKEARRLAISKDDLRLFEQQLLWSPELKSDVLSYWKGLNAAWDNYQTKAVLPPCTCAEYEINNKTGVGFMADPKWNPYFYAGEPCSAEWFNKWAFKDKETVNG